MSTNNFNGDLTATSGASDNKTVSHMLGEITWLLSQSQTHKHLFISDLEWMVMPAILLEQFRLFYGPNSPAAVALWAKVSKETDQRLRDGGEHKLRMDEWKGGDIYWLIELIAPFGAQEEILADLSKSVFNGKPFHFHQMTKQGRTVQTIDPSKEKPSKEEELN